MGISLEHTHRHILTFKDILPNSWFVDMEENVYVKKILFKFVQSPDAYNALKFCEARDYPELCYITDDTPVTEIDPEITIKF